MLKVSIILSTLSMNVFGEETENLARVTIGFHSGL